MGSTTFALQFKAKNTPKQVESYCFLEIGPFWHSDLAVDQTVGKFAKDVLSITNGQFGTTGADLLVPTRSESHVWNCGIMLNYD